MKTKPESPRPRQVDPLDWIGESGAQPDILRAMDRQLRQRRRRRIKSAAGLATACLLALLVWHAPWKSAELSIQPSASIHVPARQVLPDGSVVELKDGASIEVSFTPAARRVSLTRGEAYFQVAHNKDIPFIVAVDNVGFRAVGTAFSVDRRLTQVELLVTEGRVAVDHLSANSPIIPPTGLVAAPQTIATVGVGERTIVPLNLAAVDLPKILALPIAEIKELQSWRVPRLEFSGTPLGEAIPMINAHSPVKLILGDASLASVRISGVLRADNIETLRELLLETHGIHAEYRSPSEIVLSRP